MLITSVQAQYDNIGDLIIRSTLVEWLAEIDAVLAVAGKAPAEYIEALQLPAGVETVTNIAAARAATRGGRVSLVFAPGEQSLEARWREVSKAAMNVALSCLVRVSGGKVVKVGRGYKGDGRILTWIERAQQSVSNMTYVRDKEAAAIFRRASLIPDIALSSKRLMAMTRPAVKDRIVVSLRADRTHDTEELRQLLAHRPDLRPQLVAQVKRDEASSGFYAKTLNADHLAWQGSMNEHLPALMEAYSSARFIISDRLHALLFALCAGAVPIGLETGKHRKLSRQLEAIGLTGHVSTYSALENIFPLIHDSTEAANRARLVLDEARAEHIVLREELRRLLSREASHGR